MIAANTVFLNESRTKAVPEGSPEARYKLVHKGQEISAAQCEKYEGAIELVGGTKKAPVPSPTQSPPRGVSATGGHIEAREPEPKHRDPKHKR